MIVKNQSLLIAYNTEAETVAGAIVTQDVYDDDGTPVTTRTKPLGEVELSESLASINAALLAERDAFAAQVAELTAERDEWKEKANRCFPDHQPRMIDPAAWYARFTMENVLAISELAANDDNALGFVTALKTAREARRADPTYQMSLDAEVTQQGVAYLRAIGALSDDDVARVLADSLPTEA